MSAEFSDKFYKEKAYAEKIAKEKGWEIIIDNDSVYMELMRISKEGNPVYYKTNNKNAANSTRANTLHSGDLLGLNLEGQGMTAHVWDVGVGIITHQEYDGAGGNNRYSIGDGSSFIQDHSTHVMGTIISSGVQTSAKGMAPQANGIGYSLSNDQGEASTAAANGMLLSNHSYGFELNGTPAENVGDYNSTARDWDDIMYNAPYYLMVNSAGNDGTHTYNPQPLEGNSSYDKLMGISTAKNNLVVANGNDAGINTDGSLHWILIDNTSSQGPTDDYRIKPDITGNGAAVYSTIATNDAAYTNKSGTSMASPNVLGTLLLLQQHYNNINSNFMKAATLKGLALHTADDDADDYDGGIDGPDPIHGWGLLNGMKAAQTITNEGATSIIMENSLTNSSTYTYDVYASGTETLIASISWTDPAGNEIYGTNTSTPALVNDLDIRITESANTYYPYKLTTGFTSIKADNNVDPFERIDVENATAGTLYTITVTHKGTLGSSQNYSLIVTGITTSTTTTVITNIPSSITINSASVGGNVTNDGGYTVTERGVVWGTSANPTTGGNKLQIGIGTGTFSNTLSSLSVSTIYHVRAYAINSQGTFYGQDKQFTTLDNNTNPPTVSTTPASSIGQTSASVGGNVSDQGGNVITERGIVWGLTTNPTTSGNKFQIGSGIGVFNSSLIGLPASTIYHIRAYAINSYGTSYGDDEQFTTLSTPVKPEADFYGTPLTINENQTVVFSDLSTNAPTSWLWTVSPSLGVTTEGGTDLNSQNPQIQFANEGAYTITLVATNTAGDSDPKTEIDYIIVIAGTQDYCVSTYTATSNAKIENVTFNTINNNSGDAATDGYEDYTSISTTVNPNSIYTLSVTVSTTSATDHIEAYFDWNADGDWTDAGELISLGTLTNQISGIVTTDVTIPSGASISAIRMRVNTEFNNAPGPCDTDHSTEYGETEDYTINISDYVTGYVSFNKENITIYPNPAEDILHITLPVENVKIELINMLGKTLKTIDTSNNKQIDIDINELNSGIYNLIITTKENKQFSVKVVKK